MAVCRAAGVVAATETAGLRRLHHALSGGSHLLVLDNAENLPDAVSAVVEGLAPVPGLRILVASRVPLGRDWEHVWLMPPLRGGEARSLLLERMAREPSLTQVAALNQAADGIPLAIELLAAQSSVLGPASVVARLDDLDILLTRAGTDRHASLARILEGAYQALPLTAQQLLGGLALFRGGFTSEHVDRVGGAMQLDGIPALGELLAAGLVHRDADDRHRMLEPVRQCAIAHLEADDGIADAETAMVQWAVEFTRERQFGFTAADNRGWRRSLDAEADNLDLAFAMALRHGDEPAVLRLLAGLSYYWSRHHPESGATNARAATALVQGAASSRRRAGALAGLALFEPDPELHAEWLRLAAEEYRAAGDARGEVVAAYELAISTRQHALIDEALTLAAAAEEAFLEGWLLVRRAGLLHRDGVEAGEVLAILDKALQIGRRLDNRQLLGGVLLARSSLRLSGGNAGPAVGDDLDEARSLLGPTGDPVLFLEAHCLGIELLLLRGEVTAAIAAARDATQLCESQVSNEVMVAPARVARLLLLVLAALCRGGHDPTAAAIAARSGDLAAASSRLVQSGERYPLAPSILTDVPSATGPVELDDLTDALRLAHAAVASGLAESPGTADA
jgi:hypothetical protein